MRTKMGKARRVVVALLAVALAVLLLVTACAPAQTVEKETVIEIWGLAPLTGSAASSSQAVVGITGAFLQYVEEVGIPGVSLPPGVNIELVWQDDALQTDRAISSFQRAVDRGVALLWIISPTSAEPLKAKCEKHQMPAVIFAITDFQVYPPGWLYAWSPTEAEHFAVVCDWIMQNWKEARPPKLATIGPDSPYGRALYPMGIEYAKSKGVEILPGETASYVPLDVTPQLMRLQDQGADFVYISSIVTAAVTIVRDAERLGLLGEIQFGGYEATQDIPVIQALGPAAEGYFSARRACWVYEPPFWAICQDMEARYRGGRVDWSGQAQCVFTYFPATIEAIRRAVEEVGAENVDNIAVKQAMDSIANYDPMGVGRPVTWSNPDDRRGCANVKIYRVQNGQPVPVSDWVEAPMLCSE